MLLKSRPATIDDYIAAAPLEDQQKLIRLHDFICKAAPGANEGLKWNMPAYSYKRILVTFALYENHIGFYPTPSAIICFSQKLTKYRTGASSVQFPLDKPLPLTLIRKIVKFRVWECAENDVKWK
ncbi:MAG: DUF1801 domain-containing protein [Ginsengibacter sp.]